MWIRRRSVRGRFSLTVNIAIFGGTFDPIHIGHLRAAKMAARKFSLDKILFVPSGNPPHKRGDRLTPFAHRFAMVTLACKGDARLIPSLIEAPRSHRKPQYSIDTARAVRRSLKAEDQLYFLLGLDAYLDLPHWKNHERLFNLLNFIVVSRPGFDTRAITEIVPERILLQHARASGMGRPSPRTGAVNVLHGVRVAIASRDIREAIAERRPITGLVPPVVEEYIVKERLYETA